MDYGEANKPEYLSVTYSNNFGCLPESIDVLIIATSSLPRRRIFEQIVDKSQVKHVIFEKFLFPAEEDYLVVTDIIERKRIKAYVNCPSRLYPGYHELKDKIKGENMLNVRMSGSVWGLSCNAIHMIDCVGYLIDSYNDIVCDTLLVDNRILESKRSGYIEFTGTLLCSIPGKANIIMESFPDGSVPFTITFSCNKGVWIVSEPDQTVIEILDGSTNKFSFPTYYQSQLTSKVVEEILQTDECSLTRYEDTVSWHLSLLHAFLDKYNYIIGSSSKSIPIT